MYDIEFVDYIDKNVAEYNRNVSKEQELKVKTGCKPLDYSWNIDDPSKKLDVINYITEQHLMLTHGMDSDECDARDIRLAAELQLFTKLNLIDVLRTIIFIINKLTAEDIVWGVGRGSSVSSYILYVIGVHDVDSFMYDLDINDFLRNT